MKKNLLLALCLMGFTTYASSQKDSTILRSVKSWVLTQNGISVDTIAVDTAFIRVNNYNLVNKKYPNAFLLSNKGSEYRSNSLEDQGYVNDFLFITNLNIYFKSPYDIEFFNTTTPYTNLQYYYAPPKRRSEESVSVLHTQNITRNWNAGMNYNLSSSIGRYDASQADYRNFRFFSSYSGDKYSVHGAVIYNKSFNFQNGGLVDDSVVIKHSNSNLEPENIPVYLRTSQTQIENQRGFITQSLAIGSDKSSDEDSIKRFPLATVSYTLDVNRYSRVYLMDDDALKDSFYNHFNIDSITTRDSTKYNVVNNLFQLKFNEEANPFFKLGARVYISNIYEFFQQTAPSVYKTVGFNTIKRYDQHQSSNLTTTLVGGEVFKRTGNNLWWNTGAKIYIQGYRAGEFLLNGAFDSRFSLFKSMEAGLFAKGSVELITPNYFQEHFYSNHLQWNESFEKEKAVRLKFGIKVPTSSFQIAAHMNTFQNHIYFNHDGLPIQESDVVQTYGITVYKHLKAGNFHSINDAVVQYTSNDVVVALPSFSIYSSNYVQFNYSKVLDIQFGFDIRYNTAFYSPSYMPATAMFTSQRIRKTGNFPAISPFMNAHIKRFNFFLEFTNVNLGYPSYDAFYTVGYALNPASLRFGVQWNFYN